MNIRQFLIILSVFFIISCQTKNTIHCEIKTTQGSIIIELYPDKAPITVANFMTYINKGIYTNSSFFRVCNLENEADRTIKIEVIQGGFDNETNDLSPIVLETTKQTGIKHLNGTISMERDEPNSATNSFFICIGDQPSLDFGGKRNPDRQGFAAFGKVVKGMDIILKIQKQPDSLQYLLQPITIESIKQITL